MPIMWDIPRQEFISCEDPREIRWFRGECIYGMGIVVICYVTVFLQQIARSEDSLTPQVSLLSLISFFSAAQVSLFCVVGGMSLQNYAAEYARGYNFLKHLEDELIQAYPNYDRRTPSQIYTFNLLGLYLTFYYITLPIVMLFAFLYMDIDPAMYILDIIFGPSPPRILKNLALHPPFLFHLPRLIVRSVFIWIFAVGFSRLAGIILSSLLTILKRMRHVLQIIRRLNGKTYRKIRAMMYYNELQLIFKDIAKLQDSIASGLLIIGFSLNGFTIYILIQGYRVLPFGVYSMFVGVAVMNLAAITTSIPFCVDTNRISLKLRDDWKQLDNKLQRKRAIAMPQLNMNFSFGQFRIFRMTKVAKNKLYSALVDFPVNMLLGYSRAEFEMSFAVRKQN
ncbi:hypothetical protein Fcan01_16823 [Folsomia candida]|uniref:Odorant receptor n=1 Tax=Folsomia candida TaxID=158441 RepID=A0A226DTC5_FOLCA|nr:hypothetical protein Fcan01_16823 [Folsomia candida]